MSHHVTEVKEICYGYPDGHQAIKGMSFRIIHGESVGIIGANGAGKSTLLKLLIGVLFPTAGQVIVGDIIMTKKTLPFIRQRMGLVFQNPDDQLFMTTVYDDVAFGPRNYMLDEKEVGQRVEAALEQVGILHLKDRPPFKLSGGEKRAASIATVLSMQPDILLMDEPTASLDPKSRRRVINLLKSFNHTKIIATHDLDMVLENCERTIVMKEGQIAVEGPSSQLLRDEKILIDCGLELPMSLQACPFCGTV